MGMIKAALVDRDLERHGLPTDGGLPDKCLRLSKHYAEVLDDQFLCDCDCGGVSDTRLPACPYCGEVGDVLPPAPTGPDAPLAQQPAAQLASPEDLATDCKKIRIAVRDAARGVYEAGCALARIYDTSSWKLLLGDKGEPKYSSFWVFAAREFGMSRTYASDSIRVSRKFSREQVEQFGASKLTLALRAPAEQQEEVQAAVERGESRRDIEDRLKRLREKGAGSSDAPKVTVALALAHQVVPLCKRGTTDAPAKKVDDDPWAEVELSNEVTLGFRLLKGPEGELLLTVEARRTATVLDAPAEAPGPTGGDAPKPAKKAAKPPAKKATKKVAKKAAKKPAKKAATAKGASAR